MGKLDDLHADLRNLRRKMYAAYASEPAMMAVQPCFQAATAAWSSRNFVIQELWCMRCMICTRGQKNHGWLPLEDWLVQPLDYHASPYYTVPLDRSLCIRELVAKMIQISFFRNLLCWGAMQVRCTFNFRPYFDTVSSDTFWWIVCFRQSSLTPARFLQVHGWWLKNSMPAKREVPTKQLSRNQAMESCMEHWRSTTHVLFLTDGLAGSLMVRPWRAYLIWLFVREELHVLSLCRIHLFNSITCLVCGSQL